MIKKVTIKYFALFRDRAGKDEEVWSTPSTTFSELFDEVSSEYQFNLEKKFIRVARNESYCGFEEVIEEGDVISFLPPLSGG